MTAKLRADLKAENATDLPDNITGLISASDLRGQLDDIIDSATFPEDGGTGSSGTTVDTGEAYRIIMLSDGTVRAIPFAAVAPLPPAGLALVTKLTSIGLTWTAAVGADSYRISRDGVIIGTSDSTAFRDTHVTIGSTYSYTVSSLDQYQQRSPETSPVSTTITMALNSAPAGVVITCWPTPIPTDGPAFIRVCAREIDIQIMSTLLNVDAGALTATNDPSLWIIRI